MIRLAADELLSDLHLIQNHSKLDVQLYSDFNAIRDKSSIDALLVRTNYRFDEMLLSEFTNLKFIATASAGFDHFDIDYFAKKNITWQRSAGCNSKSVAEYVFATLLFTISDEERRELSKKRIGILGVGACGTQVQKIAQKLGLETILYDPPREEREKTFQSCSLEELKKADYLTVHVPLDSKTLHIINHNLLVDSMISVVINAARGGVLDERIIFNFPEIKFILDVWENEPNFNTEVAKIVEICTPHIAGYSETAKRLASRMAYQNIFNHFGLNSTSLHQSLGKAGKSILVFDSFKDLIRRAHPFLDYQERLKQLFELEEKNRMHGFHTIRNSFPLRAEFHETGLKSNPLDLLEKEILFSGLNFRNL